MVNVAFNETMSFGTQRMSSETSVSWQSRLLVRDQVAKATDRQKNGSAEESTIYLTQTCQLGPASLHVSFRLFFSPLQNV